MNILNSLKKSENMRKIFGKKELIIIEKQLMGIRLKPSEKTRLTRDIRKKFEAIKELSPFINNFNLKHGEITKELIEDSIDAIKDTIYFSKIKRIYLFGSTAENRHIFRSDIDLAAEFDSISKEDTALFRIKAHVPEKIDLQVFNALPEKIKSEILKKGKVI